MYVTRHTTSTVPAPLPAHVVHDDLAVCQADDCTHVIDVIDQPTGYCDDCFDEHCCSVCQRDLEGEPRCADCWEPDYIKPAERY